MSSEAVGSMLYIREQDRGGGVRVEQCPLEIYEALHSFKKFIDFRIMQELEFEHWAPKNFSKTARWNPDKKHVSYALASANKLELNTLDSEAHEQTTVISFKVEISLYEWSPCGKFIYVYLKKQNLLSIFDVDKQKIVHSILTDDVGDLLAIKWSPDSLNLLGLSADRSLLMIWPLNLCDSPQRERTSKSYERGNLAIKYPKILPLSNSTSRIYIVEFFSFI